MSIGAAVAIPEPPVAGDLAVPVSRVCSEITAWAEDCEDISALNDAKFKLEAIDTYLERTSNAGRQEVAATMARLEVRIGSLMPPHQGKELPSHVKEVEARFNDRDKAELRLMAAHPEVVEEVIARSSDERPASRRAVIGAIRQHTVRQEVREQAEWVHSMVAEAAPDDMAEGRRRQQIQMVVGAVSTAVRELLETASPDEMRWALTTGAAHVSDVYRTNFTIAVKALGDYWTGD